MGFREMIECACSGVMACSTCQVYVHDDWFGKVGEPCEAETDMLELAHDPRDTSRLGCQLKLRADLDGLEITVPDGANNMFDHILSIDGTAASPYFSKFSGPPK